MKIVGNLNTTLERPQGNDEHITILECEFSWFETLLLSSELEIRSF